MTLDALFDAFADRLVERLAAKLSTREAVDDLLSEADLVPRYFRTRRALADAVNERGLVASRCGRTIVVHRADLDRFLASRVARRTRAPSKQATREPTDDEQLLAKAGLKLVRRG